jgi:HEPN domain-containing protein
MEISKKDIEYAKNLIRKAEEFIDIIEQRKEAFSSPSNSIFLASISIELNTKAVFILLGIDFPQIHDIGFEKEKSKIQVSELIKRADLLKENFPNWKYDLNKISSLVQLCQEWGGKEVHEHALYGNEELREEPDKLFLKEKTDVALKDAKKSKEIAKVIETFVNVEYEKINALFKRLENEKALKRNPRIIPHRESYI